MKCSIHQPNYFPRPAFFNKIDKSDVFVLLNDCQFEKGGYTNRTLLNINGKDVWMTIPLKNKNDFINNIYVDNQFDWRRKHITTIKNNFKKDINILNDNMLSIITTDTILSFVKDKSKIISSSMLAVDTTGTQRLIDICKAVGADTYISGLGGKLYMDESLFFNNNIKLEYMESDSRRYSILNYV